MQTGPTPPPPAPPATLPAQAAVFILDLRVLQQLLAEAEGRGRQAGYIEGLEDSARALGAPTAA
jgi:hypothetical protein